VTGLSGRRTIVVDLEATCWDEREPVLASQQRGETEVIEIGAVLLAGTPSPATFRAFVRPVRRPALSAFCTELTGITQADVADARPFPEVFRSFLAFCGGDDDLVFASWGAWDDAMLRKECKRHGLPAPRWSAVNVKALFAARRERLPLGAALADLGLPFDGRPHRGLDDARNVVRVLAWLQLQEPGGPSTT
jgi:3'-5' exoribonuclease 1